MNPYFGILLLGTLVLPACGGSDTGDDVGRLGGDEKDAGDGDGGAGGGDAGPAASGGAPRGSGGRGGASPASGGAGEADASSADATAGDAAVPVCPITKSGTELTEADCHKCFLPNRDCTGSPPGIRMTTAQLEETCVRLTTDPGTLWCLWYADEDPFDQPWGALYTCPSSSGHVYCGGGL